MHNRIRSKKAKAGVAPAAAHEQDPDRLGASSVAPLCPGTMSVSSSVRGADGVGAPPAELLPPEEARIAPGAETNSVGCRGDKDSERDSEEDFEDPTVERERRRRKRKQRAQQQEQPQEEQASHEEGRRSALELRSAVDVVGSFEGVEEGSGKHVKHEPFGVNDDEGRCPVPGGYQDNSSAPDAYVVSTAGSSKAVASEGVDMKPKALEYKGLVELSHVSDLLKDESIGAVVLAATTMATASVTSMKTENMEEAPGEKEAGGDDGVNVPEMTITGRRLNNEVRFRSVLLLL